MSKFSIDLEGLTLPDAIAAVVEAWYEAQNVESSTDWVDDLRLQIKREFGRGWFVRGVGITRLNPEGKCQLTRIAPDRSRNSVLIPIEWHESNVKKIKSYVYQLIDLYNGTGGNLQGCLNTMKELGVFAPTPANAI